ncbi:MAG TPA: hypothetical protein PK405_03760, partial [Hyphomicrobiales bacterium]|nr:hypothetical protein [Hyphomicrobiales bacterium]
MTLFETLSDAMTLAATVLSGAAGEPDEAQVALAWLARNRRDQALGAKGWQFGDGSLAEACR